MNRTATLPDDVEVLSAFRRASWAPAGLRRRSAGALLRLVGVGLVLVLLLLLPFGLLALGSPGTGDVTPRAAGGGTGQAGGRPAQDDRALPTAAPPALAEPGPDELSPGPDGATDGSTSGPGTSVEGDSPPFRSGVVGQAPVESDPLVRAASPPPALVPRQTATVTTTRANPATASTTTATAAVPRTATETSTRTTTSTTTTTSTSTSTRAAAPPPVTVTQTATRTSTATSTSVRTSTSTATAAAPAPAARVAAAAPAPAAPVGFLTADTLRAAGFGTSVSITSRGNGSGVAPNTADSDPSDTGMLRAVGGSAGVQLVNQGGSTWAIRASANGKYWCAETGYKDRGYAVVRARSAGVGSCESFKIYRFESGNIGIQSAANGNWLAAEPNYDGKWQYAIRASAGGSLGSWALFRFS